jgi:amidase
MPDLAESFFYCQSDCGNTFPTENNLDNSGKAATGQGPGSDPSGALPPAAADKVEPLTWVIYEMGLQVKASDYLLSLNVFQTLGREMDRFRLDYDVWLTPTLSEPPVPLGTFDSPPDNPLQGFFRAAEFVPFTPLANATGQPAMSVPLFWNDGGLPVGTHFMGRFGDEATLFRLASQLEEARPWAKRRPQF